MWHFDVFNKPAVAQSIQASIKPVLPGVQQQGVLTIVEAIQSHDGLSAEVTYFTKEAPHGAKVMMRLIHTGNDGGFAEFPTSEKHNTVTVKTRIGKLQLKHSLEAYISLNDTPLTPIETIPTQQDAQNSSVPSGPQPFASSGPSKKAYTSPFLASTQ